MYPQWILEMFTKNQCVHCNHQLTLDDIEAVGMQCPAPAELLNPQPLGLVLAACSNCNQRTHFTIRVHAADIIKAVLIIISPG